MEGLEERQLRVRPANAAHIEKRRMTAAGLAQSVERLTAEREVQSALQLTRKTA